MQVKSIITSISADPSFPFHPAVGNYYKVSLADDQCISLYDDELMHMFGMYKNPAELIGKELDLSQLMPA